VNALEGNLVRGNSLAAVRADNSATVAIGDNALNSNGGASVEVTTNASATFVTTQRLDALLVSGNALATMTPAGNRVLLTRSLSVSGGGKLDLNDNDFILDYTGSSQLAAVQALINAARGGGAWTGAGVTSTSARNNPKHNTTLGVMEASGYKTIVNNSNATFAGEPIDQTAVLVKYTYYGDANFDGRVTFDDYVRIDTGFNARRTGWSNGDFNGDGTVNFDDYVLIDTAFNTQGASLSRAPRASTLPTPMTTSPLRSTRKRRV
jgi:hypothetical protein